MSFVVDREELAERLTVEPNGVPAAALLDVVAATGALLQGHFALQSGHHAPYFLRFAQIGRDRAAVEQVARWLLGASHPPLGLELTVLSPESAGFALGHAVAVELRASLATARIDLRRRPLGLPLRAGRLTPGRPVVVVNDVATTAASLERLLALAEAAGCQVIGVYLFGLVEPDAAKAMLAARALPMTWLVSARWRAVLPPACEACHAGAPLLAASEFN
ncbi:MAG: hypothetical protein KF878_01330 [Planctomycetes bacterium]|nr:hypothetical protein [Planctomycetota bacterium]